MARKRMFDSEIINQDSFFEVSLEAKAIYFLLGIFADDEGFISPKKILKSYGGKAEVLEELIKLGFVIQFNSGIVVITDWNRNNWLDNRRKKETIYQEEKAQIKYNEQFQKYEMLNKCSALAKPMLIENRKDKISIEEIRQDKFREGKKSKDDKRIEIIRVTPEDKYRNEFEKLWRIYPNKRSKEKAFMHYLSSRKKGIEYQTIENGLYNYLEYINQEKTDPKFIKHGSTWFYQECWNDEYMIRPKTLKDISMQEIKEAVKKEKEQKGENSDDTIRIF